MDRILSNVQLVTSLPKNIGFPDHNETKVFLKLQASFCTGKSFSEVLILASTNPQYDKRLSSELPVQYMKIPSSEHGENMLFT